MIITLADAAARPRAEVGGKAQALGRLIRAGAPVPSGFVVPPGAAPSRAQLLAACSRLASPALAVRSSAAGEDGSTQSWAGQFASYLCVAPPDVPARLADCRDSGASARAHAYDQAGAVMPIAVIVQAMVSAEAAGVLFTANPVSGNREQIMIEAVYGLGEMLVSGTTTPDNYLLEKSTGRTLNSAIAVKTVMLVGSPEGTQESPVPVDQRDRPVLATRQLLELAAIARTLERDFDQPLDIEWAYAGSKLAILQARPITTLSGGTP